MGSIISNIIDFYQPVIDYFYTISVRSPVVMTFNERVDKELNNWMIRQYSNNVYLVKIPQKRIEMERVRIISRLSSR